jgi:putative hydroxymethylpyrimidine transport system substrate-binding protein
VRDLGIPSYDELVIVARAEPLLEDPQLFRAFTSALARGTAAAVREPEGVVSALEGADEANPSTGPKALRAQAGATIPLLSRNGYMSHRQGYRLVRWMHDEGMTRSTVGVATLLTNYYGPSGNR